MTATPHRSHSRAPSAVDWDHRGAPQNATGGLSYQWPSDYITPPPSAGRILKTPDTENNNNINVMCNTTFSILMCNINVHCVQYSCPSCAILLLFCFFLAYFTFFISLMLSCFFFLLILLNVSYLIVILLDTGARRSAFHFLFYTLVFYTPELVVICCNFEQSLAQLISFEINKVLS